MNERQVEVERARLKAEKNELKHLKAIYKKAAEDISKKIEISNGKISVLLANWDDLTEEQKSIYQSQIYQRDFQKSLQKQIDAFLKDLNSKQYNSVDEYLKDCYTTGYAGTMYDVAGQGIPLVIPIDQKQVVRAMTHDTKLSKKLYTRLGEDVDLLKKRVANNISRGIATADSYQNIARNIANGTKININRTMTIARTEGNRIHIQAADHAQHKAKDAGADIVKQWDSTLDGKTRPHHRQLDGQIREIDEPFEVDGMKVMYPLSFGIAAEDINCRCALLQRARWNLGEEELETLKERAAFFGLDKTEDFEDFKKKYLKLPEKADKMNVKASNWQGIGYSQNYQTKNQAIKALKDKYEIDFSESRKYPISENVMCDAVSWLDAFTAEYPSFTNNNPAKLPEIKVLAPSKMGRSVGYFQYKRNFDAVAIALNGQYFNDEKYLEDYVKRCIDTRWTVANVTNIKTFVHEYGHYVSNSMKKISSARWEEDFIQLCVDEYATGNSELANLSYTPTYRDLFDCGEVSRYGVSSAAECFAETFAEYFGGENPREFARIFGKNLDALLKEMELDD